MEEIKERFWSFYRDIPFVRGTDDKIISKKDARILSDLFNMVVDAVALKSANQVLNRIIRHKMEDEADRLNGRAS